MRRSSAPYLAVVLLVACATASPPTPPAPQPAVPVTAASVSMPNGGNGAPHAATLDAGTLDAGKGGALRSDPGTFGCGPITCKSGTQTCCQTDTHGTCVPTLPDGPHAAIGFFAAQFESCNRSSPGGSALSGIARCDESVDCKAGEICCEQFLFSGGTVALCEPAPKPGSTPCEFGELCLEGSPCRLPGSVCQRGHCEKTVANLPCGGERCAPGESCCGKPLVCKPDRECQPEQPRIACAHPGDCWVGQHCVVQADSSSCSGFTDMVTPGWFEARGLSLVCDRDTDCTSRCPVPGPKRARCEANGLGSIKTCRCRP